MARNVPSADVTRCTWAGSDPLYVRYHDREWGVPTRRDRQLFEMLILEGAQAGLSWITILRKRQNYRRAFDGFDPVKVARYDKRKIEALLQDEGIVRNRLKVESAVSNARAFLELRAEHGTFSRFIWSFVDGEPRINHWKRMADVPAKTAEAELLSKALKQAGMRFVGPTIVYALMQSIGMETDHTTDCVRHRELVHEGGAPSTRK